MARKDQQVQAEDAWPWLSCASIVAVLAFAEPGRHAPTAQGERRRLPRLQLPRTKAGDSSCSSMRSCAGSLSCSLTLSASRPWSGAGQLSWGTA